jgi:hypothetical protein
MGEVSQPSLLIIEAARIFDAEAASLVGVFARHGFRWRVLSNDPAWPDPAWPTTASIAAAAEEFSPAIVHFALHGFERGLVLRVSESANVEEILTWEEIESLPAWSGRVVISGACSMLRYASAFLNSGALAVVAPRTTIDWASLCHFFRIFYTFLLRGESISSALLATKSYAARYYRQYDAIDVVGEELWCITSGIEGRRPPGPQRTLDGAA